MHESDRKQVSRFPVNDQISSAGQTGRRYLQEKLQDLLKVGKVDTYDMDMAEDHRRDQCCQNKRMFQFRERRKHGVIRTGSKAAFFIDAD